MPSPRPMRRLLFLPVLAAFGCTDPVSCDALNARQSSDTLRTCVSSATEGDGDDTLTLADGSALEPAEVVFSDCTTVRLKWSRPQTSGATFDDGVRLVAEEGVLEWRRGRDVFRRDSVGELAGDVHAHTGGRYAVPLLDGRLLIRSRDGSDPVDLPVDVVWNEAGVGTPYHTRYPVPVATEFSADGARLAVTNSGDLAAVVDARSGETVWQAPPDVEAPRLALSPDGRRVAARLGETTVAVWDVDSGAEVGRWDHPRAPSDVGFGRDGSLIVWLAERSSTTTTNRAAASPQGNRGGVVQSRTSASTTPPAVVVWRVP